MKTIILVTGSTAIDQTGIYDGSFEDYQAAYPIKGFNVSFQLADMRTSFGGCAPNIAHGLTQLGINAIPLSSAGRNFVDQYRGHLIDLGINIDFIAVDGNGNVIEPILSEKWYSSYYGVKEPSIEVTFATQTQIINTQINIKA